VWETKLVKENLFSLSVVTIDKRIANLTGAPVEMQLPLCGKPTDYLDFSAVRQRGGCG
jgi:hypothetical protein